jgi:IPT/TIG domain-containing protein
MKYSAAVLFLVGTLIACPLWAAPPVPVIDAINLPDELSVDGGDLVEILGHNLDGGPCELGIDCPGAAHVTFATRYADFCCTFTHGINVETSDTRMLVRTPKQEAGQVDVVITNHAGGQLFVPNAAHFGRRGFRRVLVPIAFKGEIPGALGSRWVTELSGLSNGRFPGDYEVTRTPFSGPRQVVTGGFEFTDLPSTAGGMFLYLQEQSDVALTLRVRDVSRSDQNLGTEIPLVTADETSTVFGIMLPSVPVEPKYRLTLRVYNFNGRRAARFHVRVQSHSSDAAILADADYSMPEEAVEEFPNRPGYLELSLADLLPPGHHGPIDVFVTQDLLPIARLWAMVSITNNDTQFVTTVTPAVREHGGLAIAAAKPR